MSRDQFVRETRSGIERIADGLLALEDEPTEEQLTELFRIAHTLKGNCSSAGFDAPARVAHALEDVLEAIRADRLEPDSIVIDAMLEAADVLDAMLDEITADGRAQTDPTEIVETLHTVLETRATTDQTTDIETDTSQASILTDDAIPEPGSAAGLSAEEALERASGFDDLESLSSGVDDGAPEGERTLDDLFDDHTAEESGNGSADRLPEADAEASETDAEPADVEVGGTEGSGGTNSIDFDRVRATVDTLDARTMDEELEGVEFGDTTEDDDVSVTELLDLVETAHHTDEENDGNATEQGTEQTAVDQRPAASTTATDDETVSPSAERDEVSAAESSEPESEPTSIDETEPTSAESEDPSPKVRDEPSTADRAEQAMDAAGVDDQRLVENIQQLEPTETGDADDSFVFDTDVETSQEDGNTGSDAVSGPLERDESTDDTFGFDQERPVSDGDDEPAAAMDSTFSVTPQQTDPNDALESFDRDENVREFVTAFGDSFDGSTATGPDSSVEKAVTTIPPSILPETSSEDDGSSRKDSGGTISVGGATADRLLQLSERLTTATIALERGENRYSDDTDTSEATTRTHELREIATELEEAVTTVRLQPLEQAFSGLERTARRVTRDTKTRAVLETNGGSVELDRDVVAALGGPLVHLVRNAIDHGIEPPEERAALDKPRTGTVTIDARKDGVELVLEVTDDGRGLDANTLRDAAVADGIVIQGRADAMSDEAAYELVFHPGLSTESEVTDVSGRGVGMDVVADAVSGLDGDIEVESTPGEGTTFRLRVPISIAATEVLFVEASGHPYAIPASDIARLEEFDPGRADGDTYAMTVMDDDGPTTEQRSLVGLADWFGADHGTDPTVVVHIRESRGGLSIACDDVGDWQRVVVRPYDDILSETPGMDGATLLGDGKLANVLDVTAITDGGSQ